MRTSDESPTPSPGPWLTAAEAAEYLRLPSTAALYQRIARGQMKASRLGRRFRFQRRELDALIEDTTA